MCEFNNKQRKMELNSLFSFIGSLKEKQANFPKKSCPNFIFIKAFYFNIFTHKPHIYLLDSTDFVKNKDERDSKKINTTDIYLVIKIKSDIVIFFVRLKNNISIE